MRFVDGHYLGAKIIASSRIDISGDFSFPKNPIGLTLTLHKQNSKMQSTIRIVNNNYRNTHYFDSHAH